MNCRLVVREGDALQSHCCGPPCHGSVVAKGSGSTYVNGRPVARISDPVACGGAIQVGSNDTTDE